MEFQIGELKGRVWRDRIYLYGIAEYGKDAYIDIESGRLHGRSADFGLRKKGLTVEEVLAHVKSLTIEEEEVSPEDRKKEVWEDLRTTFNDWGVKQRELEETGISSPEQGIRMWNALLRARKSLFKKPAAWFTSGWRKDASAIELLCWADGRCEDWLRHLL